MTLRFVVSTRKANEGEFLSSTLLGKSIDWIRHIYPIHVNVKYSADSGLAAVYNAAIELADDNDILVFVHDDVQIDDWQIHARLTQALEVFDVIGVAGNVSREPGQVNWWGMHAEIDGVNRFIGRGTPRGAVAYPDRSVQYWSGEPAQVKTLDGLLLAARKTTLVNHGIKFDPRFLYHLYDMDFCRQCEMAGLKCGVWPLAVTHQSHGQFSENWHEAAAAYLEKWGS